MFDDDARNADRSAADGPMGVSRMPDDTIAIEVEHDGEKQSLRCSEYNARRVFGALSVLLGFPLPRNISRKIKM